MRVSILFAFLLAITATVLRVERPARAADDADRPGWTLTFRDEFDGATVDPTKWVKRYKWGEAQVNGELQAYVDDAFSLRDGILTITGDKRAASYAGQTFQYASGVLCSVLEQTYGTFEARLKVPPGQGVWPAFWLLGQVGAPGVNEIDIHEILGNQPSTAYMTVHWGTDYDAGHKSSQTVFVGDDFSADFHVFGLAWTSDALVWTIDGVERKRYAGEGVPQVPMYVILNLALGGSWPGAPDATTPFPAAYQIDYVRAYTSTIDGGPIVLDGGGAPATGDGGGCGCVVGGPTGAASLTVAFLVTAACVVWRRRRR